MVAQIRSWGQQAKRMPLPSIMKGRSSPVVPLSKEGFEGVFDTVDDWSRQSTGEPDPLAPFLEMFMESEDSEQTLPGCTLAIGTFEDVFRQLIVDDYNDKRAMPAEVSGQMLGGLERVLESVLESHALQPHELAEDAAGEGEDAEEEDCTALPSRAQERCESTAAPSDSSSLEMQDPGEIAALKSEVCDKLFRGLERALNNGDLECVFQEIAQEADDQGYEMGSPEPWARPLHCSSVKGEVRDRFFSSCQDALDSGALEDVLAEINDELETAAEVGMLR